MNAVAIPVSVLAAESAAAAPPTARALYLDLADGGAAAGAAAHGAAKVAAGDYLRRQLDVAAALPCDLPADLADFGQWIAGHTEAVGIEYGRYLAERKQGAPRRYFTNRSHAMHFLTGVAPTKLVDGSWLYGLLARWDDASLRPLIRIYLEELGSGVPDKNHVLIYRRLLEQHGGGQRWQHLSDDHFVQGAIQLALAFHAERYLPELIGFNLGYEQLPLHLLITAYELNELGIDPYYFTLHVTVDNADTGHALTALRGLEQAMPAVGDRAAFLRRVAAGYRLNDLGASTLSVIASFDLEREVIAMLAAKSVVGKHMHSDYCRVAGRTVNEWLADPAQIGGFVAAMEANGWIRRGEAPENSRFWRLVQGERAEMFGVFSAYELQLLQDWIAAPRAAGGEDGTGASQPASRVLSYRARVRGMAIGRSDETAPAHRPRPVLRRNRPSDNDAGDDANELRQLQTRLAALDNQRAAIGMLVELMSPALHHTPPGLMATRIFTQLYE